MVTATSRHTWTPRFEDGELEARRKAGEWTGETLADAAKKRASEQPEVVAITGENGAMTYAQVLEQATNLARGLLEIGLARGDTVSFQLPNWTEAVVVDLACCLGGFINNPVIPIYRQAELRFILNDCRSKLIFIPEHFRGIDYPGMIAGLREDVPGLEHVVVVRGTAAGAMTLKEILAAGQNSKRDLVAIEPDAAKFIMYTSGTTGQPKGVIYSSNQQRRPLWASIAAWGIQPGAKLLMPSPVTHVTGYSYGMEMPFLFDTRTVFMEKWDASRAVDLIDEHGIEFTIGATPFLFELVEQAERRGTRLDSLKIFACGGAAVPPELIRRATRVFSNAKVFRAFGSSECPMVTQGVLDDPELAATTDGRIYDWDVKIIDGAGNLLPEGSEGEILAKGPSLFRGYTNPDANREAFDPDGYFRTGDIGVVTNGDVLTITGRKKDIIIRGGENLSAKEIEDALHEHPAIREAAVVAIPHKRLGEGVCAYLIARGPMQPDQAELATYFRERGLAPQKIPEYVEYVEELPKTASGKVQKHILRRLTSDIVARKAQVEET